MSNPLTENVRTSTLPYYQGLARTVEQEFRELKLYNSASPNGERTLLEIGYIDGNIGKPLLYLRPVKNEPDKCLVDIYQYSQYTEHLENLVKEYNAELGLPPEIGLRP